ncbi:MAG: hypothetical protein CME04_24390 [Gemmatimonadaceae bacterium]|nr:hypothetical protein [Gemmatimonadaceae bacterium]
MSPVRGRSLKGLLKRTWARRLLSPMGHDLQPQRWVFIVGCYNSGTTLLRDLLGRHPRIDALPSEGVRLTDALPRPEDSGWHRMWCRCVDDVRLSTDSSQTSRAARIRRHWSLVLPSTAAIVLEKSIANTARLPFLQTHFAPAYIIHLVRNGYAVAEGLRRKGQPRRFGHEEFGDAYPLELCAEQWRCSMEQVEADASGLDHLLEVRYEELTADAAGQLARVTSFLELEPLVADSSSGDFDIHGVRSTIRDMNEDSLERLTVPDVDEIERVAGPLLERYGYARP